MVVQLTKRRFNVDEYKLLLVVEVVDSTADYAPEVKVQLYASAGVPELWLVDLPGQATQVYRGPSPTGRQRLTTVFRGQGLSPEVFPDVLINASELLPL